MVPHDQQLGVASSDDWLGACPGMINDDLDSVIL
jgi:hypothetical protein